MRGMQRRAEIALLTRFVKCCFEFMLGRFQSNWQKYSLLSKNLAFAKIEVCVLCAVFEWTDQLEKSRGSTPEQLRIMARISDAVFLKKCLVGFFSESRAGFCGFFCRKRLL